MNQKIEDDAWSQYRHLVLREIERQQTALEQISEKMISINSKLSVIEDRMSSIDKSLEKCVEKVSVLENDMTAIKVKSGMIGAIAGIVVAIVIEMLIRGE